MKKGFTLAEVLITLGIIGVVAAMTIPTLIANTRSQQYRSKFKKTVSTLSQAARMSDAQYGFDYAGINTKCGSDPATENPENIMSVCSLLNGTLTGATYTKAGDLKMKKGKDYVPYTITSSFQSSTISSLSNLSLVHAYVLSDGTIVAISPELGMYGCNLAIGTKIQNNYGGTEMASCAGFIDVNGTALPNKEVSCSSGSNSLTANTCIVKNDAQHMTDIYPIRFHNGSVIPATAAARYVLNTAK